MLPEWTLLILTTNAAEETDTVCNLQYVGEEPTLT